MADELIERQSQMLEQIRRRTPARLMVGRFGGAYSTESALELRQAHAAARDAVYDQFHPQSVFPDILTVSTLARDKQEFLLRPGLGRRLSDASREELKRYCPAGAQLQIVIGDGLSATAVHTQVPPLLPLLLSGAQERGWSVGRVVAVHYCRVGVVNDIGDLLAPEIVVLLIGERPGLATAESLSAYMAYRPKAGHTDGDRNLISNIHSGGTPVPQASERILNLAAHMIERRLSGASVKEEWPELPSSTRPK